jgi:hypothetical protein
MNCKRFKEILVKGILENKIILNVHLLYHKTFHKNNNMKKRQQKLLLKELIKKLMFIKRINLLEKYLKI